MVLQDMPLYHHESLSRGNDDDKEKLLRLLREKDKLYERHPGLYGKDPFYHKYLAGDMLSTGFELKAEYEPEKEELPVRTMDTGELERGAREDGCVMISLEYAGPAADFGGRKDKTELLIQGYCFISGSDNALFEKWILLKPEEDAEKNGGKLSGIRPEPILCGDRRAGAGKGQLSDRNTGKGQMFQAKALCLDEPILGNMRIKKRWIIRKHMKKSISNVRIWPSGWRSWRKKMKS